MSGKNGPGIDDAGTVISCPCCGSGLSFPHDQVEVEVSCPDCGHRFPWPALCLPRPSRLFKPQPPDKETYGKAETIFMWVIGVPLFALFGWIILRNGLIDSLTIALFITFVFAGGVAGFVNEWAFHPVAVRFRSWKYRRTLCAHGIKGGLNSNRCGRCQEWVQLEGKETEARRRLEKHRKCLVEDAVKLRDHELERIRFVWMARRNGLLRLSPQKFEDFVAELVRKMGYSVKQTPYSNDRGRDAIAERAGEKIIIECKRYAPERKIGRPPLQLFFAAVIEDKALEGWFVTTSSFGKTAFEYAADKPLRLIDGKELTGLVARFADVDSRGLVYRVMCVECGRQLEQEIHSSDWPVKCPCGRTLSFLISEKDIFGTVPNSKCPQCGQILRERTGPGGRFLGCSRYPRCRFTKSISRRLNPEHFVRIGD